MKYHSKKCVIAGAILAGGNARRVGGIAKGALELASGVSIVIVAVSNNCETRSARMRPIFSAASRNSLIVLFLFLRMFRSIFFIFILILISV